MCSSDIGEAKAEALGVERGAAEGTKKFLEWPTMASFMCYSGSVNNQPTAETLWAFLFYGLRPPKPYVPTRGIYVGGAGHYR